LEGIKSEYKRIEAVSAERIRDEFIKILETTKPSRGFEIMEATGLLGVILPELEACKGVEQKGFHKFDVYTHSLVSCDMADNSLVIRLAALFHDIGKPQTLSFDSDGRPIFYRHEEVSSQLTVAILDRFRFPKKTIHHVSHLIHNHMFNYDSQWSDAAVRRFISRVGKECLKSLFQLRVADQRGITGENRPNPMLQELEERIERIIQEDSAFSIEDLAVDGNDLAVYAGIPRGPEMGIVLQFLLDSVLDDPAMNDKETLLRIAENYYNEYIRQ
jgi:poly(A) polymerase/tRNA nucleotidyltransferase (CCA-adding enzyme)